MKQPSGACIEEFLSLYLLHIDLIISIAISWIYKLELKINETETISFFERLHPELSLRL